MLADDARIESITASNEIEGIVVDPDRAEKLAQNKLKFKNRSEKEFAGYRDALDELTGATDPEPLTIPFILHLHRQIFQYSGGRGGYLKTDPNLIVSRTSGKREVVFEPPLPEDTPNLLSELVERYNSAQEDAAAHPLVLLGAFIVDFLAIHPVADGNGRLARLLSTHELLSKGYGVARYVSVEQRVFETKAAYYASLYESQRSWQEGDHSVWPFITYLLSVLTTAYDTFEARAVAAESPLGSKQDQVRRYILERGDPEFSRREVERALPGVSPATVRLVLSNLRAEGRIKSNGSGRSARWSLISVR